jgi:hypothetical protein
MVHVDALPAEIHAEIFGLVSLSSTASLRACLLVSKTWLHRARPLLYSNIVLSSPESIVKLCWGFNFADHRSLVKSLTF